MKITRVLFLLFFVHTAFAQQPNIILMMADDLGYGDVGFTEDNIPVGDYLWDGNLDGVLDDVWDTPIQTPEMDALAAEGVELNYFYSVGPVCSPTRGSFLTGRHYGRFGIFAANKGALPAEEINIPMMCKSMGYATGHFGKWHLGSLDENRSSKPDRRGKPEYVAKPWERGYDYFFGTESSISTYDPQPGTYNGGNTGNPYVEFDVNGTATPTIINNLYGDDSQIMVDKVKPFITDAVNDNKPFLAVVWFHAPHEPFVASAADRALYSSYAADEQHYFGCVTAMSRAVGNLNDFLVANGLDDNTIILFTSDNGPEGKLKDNGTPLDTTDDFYTKPGRAGNLKGRKRSTYNGGVLVPTFLKWPGKTDQTGFPSESDYQTSVLDLFPSIMDAIGYTMPDSRPIDGRSIIPYLDNPVAGAQRPNPIPFLDNKKITWVEDDVKYRTDFSGSLKEAYDLLADREESTDLIIGSSLTPEQEVIEDACIDWNCEVALSYWGFDYPTPYSPAAAQVVENYSGLTGTTLEDAIDATWEGLRDVTCLIPLCDITDTASDVPVCNGLNADFTVTATVANGSGDYNVVDVITSNILGTISGAATDGLVSISASFANALGQTVMISVEDANDANCAGLEVSVMMPVCTNDCGVSSIATTTPICNGLNADFTVTATVANGSGDYNVIDTGTNAVLGSITGGATDGLISINASFVNAAGEAIMINVVDPNNAGCEGTAISVSLPNCGVDCGITSVVSGTATCNGAAADFAVTATVTNGSGDYNVIDAGTNAVLGSITGGATDGSISIDASFASATGQTIMVNVVDPNNIGCEGIAISLVLPDCTPAGCTTLSIGTTANAIVQDFQGFAGMGLANPPAANQLNSCYWVVEGLGGGNATTTEGGSFTGVDTHYARGTTDGTGVATIESGLYACVYEDGTGSGFQANVPNEALWMQPSGGDLTPGALVLKLANNSGTTMADIDVSYDILYLNDKAKSSFFNFSWSTDGVNYTAVPTLDFATPVTSDNLGLQTTNRATTLTGINLVDGANLFIRWDTDNAVSGSGFDEFGLDNIAVSSQVVLPVELIDFSGTNKDGVNTLTWVTTNEYNNRYFAIERSADARRFTSIGRVEGTNATAITNYEFIDEAPLKGNNYYRLRQVDVDGAYSYSDVILLQHDVENDDLSFFPNPATDMITFNKVEGEEWEVLVFDILGNKVMERKINTNRLNVSTLAAGVYTVCLINQDRKRTCAKLVKS